jgi:hypothetical protein
MSISTESRPSAYDSKSAAAAENRIRHNRMIAQRYTTILYVIVLGGLGIILGSGISTLIAGASALVTVIASAIVFGAAGFTILAINYREEEIAYDNIILSQRRRRSSRTVAE